MAFWTCKGPCYRESNTEYYVSFTRAGSVCFHLHLSIKVLNGIDVVFVKPVPENLKRYRFWQLQGEQKRCVGTDSSIRNRRKPNEPTSAQ